MAALLASRDAIFSGCTFENRPSPLAAHLLAALAKNLIPEFRVAGTERGRAGTELRWRAFCLQLACGVKRKPTRYCGKVASGCGLG